MKALFSSSSLPLVAVALRATVPSEVAVAGPCDGAFSQPRPDRRKGLRRLPKAFSLTLLASISFLFLNSSAPVRACAACFGDTSGSKQGIAATWGIFAMVIIMFGMLGAVAAFGFYLRYRAMHPLPDYDELLSETDPEPNPGPTI